MGDHDLAVFGDWHMNSAWATRVITDVADATTGRDWYHVGDFGMWSTQPRSEGRAYLDAVQTALTSVGATLHVVLGNHENYDLLDDFVRAEAGWSALAGWDRICFAPRAHVWAHPDTDVSMAALGGAGSIDLRLRRLGRDWWMQEQITEANVATLVDILPPGGVDVFLSHEAPAGIPVFGDATVNGFADDKVVAYCWAQRVLLREALDAATPTWALHGHWHHFHTGTVHGTRRDGQPYTTRVLGLDRDGEPGNAAVLDATAATDAGPSVPLILPPPSERAR